jgi:hypothetical protein
MNIQNYNEEEHAQKLNALEQERAKYTPAKFVKVPGTAEPIPGVKPNKAKRPTGNPTTITKVRCPVCGAKRTIEQEPDCSCALSNKSKHPKEEEKNE